MVVAMAMGVIVSMMDVMFSLFSRMGLSIHPGKDIPFSSFNVNQKLPCFEKRQSLLTFRQTSLITLKQGSFDVLANRQTRG